MEDGPLFLLVVSVVGGRFSSAPRKLPVRGEREDEPRHLNGRTMSQMQDNFQGSGAVDATSNKIPGVEGVGCVRPLNVEKACSCGRDVVGPQCQAVETRLLTVARAIANDTSSFLCMHQDRAI